MSDFHSEDATCMELLKQKSKDISETDILLKAMKDLLNRGRKESRSIEKRRNVLALDLLICIFVVVALAYFNNE